MVGASIVTDLQPGVLPRQPVLMDAVSRLKKAGKAMITVAQSKSVIAYSNLVRKITSCNLEPHGEHLAHLLGEISSEEDEEGQERT